MSRRRAREVTVRTLLVTLLVAVVAAGCTAPSGGPGTDGAGPPSGDRPSVVVTYPVLGAVVKEVVGDAAQVKVLMPDGSDPHEWSPSARDVEALLAADLVVDNGLALEGRLQDPLRRAGAKGVTVFTVADHVTVRTVRAGEGADPDDPDQAPGADDPHLWMDPLTMRQWIRPLAAALRGEGVDVGANAAAVEAGLTDLDAEVRTIMDAVPAGRRTLVTGHESLGYLAQRYGYRIVGAVVPELTSQAEASAGELAALTRKVRAAGVTVIFTETGTPRATVEAVARDTGARVVELSTHVLPADGTYRTFLLEVAATISGALR